MSDSTLAGCQITGLLKLGIHHKTNTSWPHGVGLLTALVLANRSCYCSDTCTLVCRENVIVTKHRPRIDSRMGLASSVRSQEGAQGPDETRLAIGLGGRHEFRDTAYVYPNSLNAQSLSI